MTDAALTVLKVCEPHYGLKLNSTFHEFSADLYRRTGKKFIAAEMDEIGKSDAVLFGATGLPDVRGPEGLELGVQVEVRAHYELTASLRSVRLSAASKGRSRTRTLTCWLYVKPLKGCSQA